MTWFREPEANAPVDFSHASELLAQAQRLRAVGQIAEAEAAARRALDLGEAAEGDGNPALVPFLLVYAGLLHQSIGWAAGKPFYDRAQSLRAVLR